ncbi:DUF4129 domain-containing protein [Kineococcus terrestris]|uniref:DUF4129 domain-containing protein n=1 Tax=Kineococcus terrestris TaxID=2044856 RepID=UPI0034DAC713
MTGAALGAVLGAVLGAAGVPVEPDRAGARELLARELAGAEYREARAPWLLRAWEWFADRLAQVEVPGLGTSWTGPLLVLVLVAAVAVAVLLAAGPVRRQARAARPDAVFAAGPVAAEEHFRAADAAAAAGRFDEAVQERFRGLVRSLEERVLIERRPGRTAHEVADEAAAALPGCAGELRRAARTFDDVRYGGRGASAAADADLRAVVERVAAARPAAPERAPGSGAPVAAP